MPFLLIILKLNCQDISGENGQRSSTVFGFLMPCWYSYSYRNDQYIFGQGDMTCLRSSKRSLKPSKTKYPLGKHPNNLMPHKIIPRYGLRANLPDHPPNHPRTHQPTHPRCATASSRCVDTKAPIPYLGMILEGIKLLGCFPRGYFVLLGSRVRFELLKQVISPCPKMY